MTPPLPVLATPREPSWPRYEFARPVHYMPLSRALSIDFNGDAHFCGYSVPAIPRRLSRAALPRLPDGVRMVAAIFDFDAPEHLATEEWWCGEKAKLTVLLLTHPAGFLYRTRGGYRIVYLLPSPVVIRSDEDAAAWSATYTTWCRHLHRRFGVVADVACRDWQRLFRLPHATRDAAMGPERREVIGDPARIGPWHPELAAEDLVVVPDVRVPRVQPAGAVAYVGRGRLVEAFAHRGWLGAEIEAGKIACRCPWAEAHTAGEDYDGSTVIYAAGAGDLGWWHCSHAHCHDRGQRDVRALFSDEELQRRPLPPRCGAVTRNGKACAATELHSDRRCRFHSSSVEAREARRLWALAQTAVVHGY